MKEIANGLLVQYEIPKRTGGKRQITTYNPKEVTELEQEEYLFAFKNAKHYKKLNVPGSYAYIEGVATEESLFVHAETNNNVFLKIDLTDFFGTIDRKKLQPDYILDFDFLERLEVYYEEKPLGVYQGLYSSPVLSNIYMINIDRTMFNVCTEINATYTRYSDDILISLRDKEQAEKLLEFFKDLISPYGLTIKESKTLIVDLAEQDTNYVKFLGKVLIHRNGTTLVKASRRDKKRALKESINSTTLKPEYALHLESFRKRAKRNIKMDPRNDVKIKKRINKHKSKPKEVANVEDML